jgi:hypothetical protein
VVDDAPHPPPRQHLGRHLSTSDGGPTLAGARTYHAGAFVVTILPLLAWTIRGLTRLQALATQALLGGRERHDPRPEV